MSQYVPVKLKKLGAFMHMVKQDEAIMMPAPDWEDNCKPQMLCSLHQLVFICLDHVMGDKIIPEGC